MKSYFIRTEATEDKSSMTCCYPYKQWCKLVNDFEELGIKFIAWSEDCDYVMNDDMFFINS